MKTIIAIIAFSIACMSFGDVVHDAAEFIKAQEGFRTEWYRCKSGQPTIGYGFSEGVLTPEERRLPFMSKTCADSVLKREIEKIRKELNKDLKFLKVRPQQEVVLISLAWNLGIKGLKSSSIYTAVVMRQSDARIATEIRKYVNYRDPRTGVMTTSLGLKKRRAAEAIKWLM